MVSPKILAFKTRASLPSNRKHFPAAELHPIDDAREEMFPSPTKFYRRISPVSNSIVTTLPTNPTSHIVNSCVPSRPVGALQVQYLVGLKRLFASGPGESFGCA